MLDVEQIDRRHVSMRHKIDLQVPHETGRRHPEVVPNQAERLYVLTVALPQRGDQLGSLVATSRKEPLLELIKHQDRLANQLERMIAAEDRERPRSSSASPDSSGNALRVRRSSLASVSRAVAFDIHGCDMRPSRGKSPAFKSDDLPQPEGP